MPDDKPDAGKQGNAGAPSDRTARYSNQAANTIVDRTREPPVAGPVDTMAGDAQETTGSVAPVSLSLQAERAIEGRFGRYEIVEELGRGAMGTVYLAHDTQLRRDVALKVPQFTGDDRSEQIARFYREARSMATVRHRGLCPVFDVGEIDGVHYLTMAYIEGRTLSEYTKEGKPLPGLQVAALIRKLAVALNEAHKKGIIHRDLKPANIMIDKRNEPIIMDFGLARRRKHDEVRLTQTGSMVGTPAYMSPEQVDGDLDRIGPASDLYSLGVICYQMLAGKLPFVGSFGVLMVQIMTQPPPPLREIEGAKIDFRLEAICMKAMEKQPENRHSSAVELAEELRDYIKEPVPPELDPEPDEEEPDAPEPASIATTPAQKKPRPQRKRKKKPAPEPNESFTDQLAADLFADIEFELPPKVLPARRRGSGGKQSRRKSRGAMPIWPWIAGACGAALLLAVVVAVVNHFGADTVDVGDGSSSSASADDATGDTIVPVAGGGRKNGDPKPPRPVESEDVPTVHPLKKELAEHKAGVYTVVFSPDGELLASGGVSEMCVWDARSGELRYRLPAPSGARYMGMAFSPDSRFLLTVPQSPPEAPPISIWIAATGEPAGSLENEINGPYDISFSPDGKTLLVAGKGLFIGVWDFEARRKHPGIPLPSGTWARSARFSSSDRIAFGHDQVFLCKTDRTLVKTIEKTAAPLCFSPDGRFLAGTTYNEGRVTVWNGETGEEIASWRGHSVTANVVAFSPDGNILASAGGDGKVRLWDVKTWNQLAKVSHDGWAYGVDFSPDGTTLATTGTMDNLVKLWNVAALLAQPELPLSDSDYEWSEPVNLGAGINSRFYEEHPRIAADGSTMWFSGGGELWTYTRPDAAAPFGQRTNAGIAINELGAVDSAPALTADGLTLVFASDRGNRDQSTDLWMSTRQSTAESFGSPSRLGAAVNSPADEFAAALSADGSMLYFSSNRSGGEGGADLFQATRADATSPFADVRNLGPQVNGTRKDWGPCVTPDGLFLLFSSDRSGNDDLYMSRRAGRNDSFGPPVSLGAVVNSAFEDSAPSISGSGQTLYFHSDRPGGQGRTDLWISQRVAKPGSLVNPGLETELAAAARTREIAEWVISAGGRVHVRIPSERQSHMINAKETLPTAPFEVHGVYLDAPGRTSNVGDDDMRRIAELPHLSTLYLQGTNVTGSGFAQLARIPGLRMLGMPVQFNETELSSLSNLRSLYGVNLSGSNYTDACVDRLNESPQLQTLVLQNTGMTDRGFKRLQLPELISLVLHSNQRLDDAAFEHLQEFPKLTSIAVTGASNARVLSSGGLLHFRKLTQLKRVSLRYTRVTAGGVDALKRALPECEVDWDGQPSR